MIATYCCRGEVRSNIVGPKRFRFVIHAGHSYSDKGYLSFVNRKINWDVAILNGYKKDQVQLD